MKSPMKSDEVVKLSVMESVPGFSYCIYDFVCKVISTT